MVILDSSPDTHVTDLANDYWSARLRSPDNVVSLALARQVVRAPVALATVKLLRLLPPAVAHSQLPRTLQGVANLLRNRLQRFR